MGYEGKTETKKTGGILLVFAILVSIIAMPVMIAGGLAGTATEVISRAASEETLFFVLKEENVYQYLYEKAEAALKAEFGKNELPEEFADSLLTKEELQDFVEDAVSAAYQGYAYELDLSVQTERLKEKAVAYIDELAEQEKKEQLGEYEGTEVGKQMEAEIDAVVKEEKEAMLAALEEEMASLENLLEDSINEAVMSNEVREVFESAGVLRENRSRYLYAAAATVVIAVILLLALYQLRPAGFFVPAVAMLILSGLCRFLDRFFADFDAARYGLLPADLADADRELMSRVVSAFLREVTVSFGQTFLIATVAGGVLLVAGIVCLAVRNGREHG